MILLKSDRGAGWHSEKEGGTSPKSTNESSFAVPRNNHKNSESMRNTGKDQEVVKGRNSYQKEIIMQKNNQPNQMTKAKTKS